MNAEIIAIVNQKGGVGKSFSCIIKRQGQRSDLTSAQFEQKLQWSVEKVADEAGASRATVQRYPPHTDSW